MTKRKKFWLAFGIVCTSIICLLVVLSLVFRLKNVDVEIRARETQELTKLPDGIKDGVLASGEFQIGKNILFYNVDESIKKIEKANPYVKVEQVIRYFPNTIRVYISERTMKYRVKDRQTDLWYILDSDFKVLEIVPVDENENNEYVQKTFEISNKNLNVSIKAGEFVENNEMKAIANQIEKGVYGRTKDVGKIKLVELPTENSEVFVTLNMVNKNTIINIVGSDDLTEKVRSVVTLIYEDKIDIAEGTVLTVKKDFNGEIIVIK